MAYLKVLEGMIEWGEAVADGVLPAASCVKLTGNRKAAVQSSGAAASFGFNTTARTDGNYATVAFGPGVFETDNLYGTPVAGNDLSWKPDTAQFKVKGDGEVAVAHVMAIESGVAICKSLV